MFDKDPLTTLGQKFQNAKRVAGFALFMTMIGSHTLAASDREGEKKFRDVLPEPFDIADHAGNFVPSMMITATPIMYLRNLTDIDSRPRLLKAAVGVSAIASLAANAAAETKLGSSIIPADQGTPQTLDFVYGAGATLFTASILYPRAKTLPPTPA